MPGPPPPRSATTALSAADRAREELLGRALVELRERGAEGLHAFCVDHPEQAHWLERQVEFLTELGLLDHERLLDGMPRRLGDFELQERIGGGGMGIVFRARQRSLGRDVAVKVVRPEFLAFDQARRRFAREVDAVAKVQHPAIVRVHAAGEDQGVPFLAMELLAGRTLADVIAALGTKPLRERTGADLHPSFPSDWPLACARLVAEIADGMQHVHNRGVLHRDLKPANILLTDFGRPVVIDFGLALGDDDERLTKTIAPLASLPYCAPERLRGDAATDDPRLDVYGLGATLYELLAGKTVVGTGSFETMHARALRGEFEPVRSANPQLGRDLAVVCHTALAARRKRYASMARFAADLRAVVDGRPIAAQPPGPLGRGWLWVQRRPALTLALALAFVLTAGLPLALLAREWASAAERAPLLATATVDRLLEAEAELWPTSPQWLTDPRGYAYWLDEAAVLLQERPRFVRELAALRARGTHWPDGAPSEQQRVAALLAEIASLRANDAWMEAKMVYGKEARQVPLRDQVRHLESQLEELRHAFPEPAEDRRHVALVRLLAKIDRVERLRSGMLARRAHALAIAAAERAAAADFAAAAAAIADRQANPHYRGLRLAPQAGLVPLGKDPHSGLFEFAHLPSGKPATRDAKTGALQLTEDTGIVLVLLPGGTFRMGAAADDPVNRDPAAKPLEGPCRDVELAPFFLAKHELTQGQWVRLRGLNPSISPPGSAGDENPAPTTLLHPIEDVRWDEAAAALRQLGLELPTEAQWEYAARGGSHGPWGSSEERQLSAHANLLAEDGRPADAWRFHAPVGSFLGNGFGLHDMLGNVGEWCLDGGELYSVDPMPHTGQRPCRPDCPRTVRGGSYDAGAHAARVSARTQWPPGSALMQVGVRAVRRVQ